MWGGGAIMDSLCRVGPSVGRLVRLHFRVRSITPIPIEGFSSNLAQMFTSTRGCAEPMLLICQLKVKVTIEGQISNTIKYQTVCCVRSVSPTIIEGFSSNLAQMFTSTRGCAEPMLCMCRLKVKVTIEGQISNNQILDSMSCPLCNSYTYWKIYFKLGSNIHLNKGMCRTYVANVSAQRQGHNWRSNIKQSNITQYVMSAL
jgi:hypothetical protein